MRTSAAPEGGQSIRFSCGIVAEPQGGQCRSDVTRHVRRKGQWLPADRVIEGQPKRMQGLAVKPAHGRTTIDRIADQRMPQTGHVDPDLVRPTGLQRALDQATGVSVLKQTNLRCRHFPRLARQVDNRHAKPVARIPAYGGVHPAKVWAGPDPMSDRQVLTTDLPRRDRLHQPIHGLARPCNHHETAGVLVEPVHDPRTGQQRSNRIARQKAVQQGAAPVSRRGMNDQTGRLVQHHYLRIFMDNVQRHCLGLERQGLRGGTQFDRKAVSEAHPVRGFEDDSPAHRDKTGLDQLLQVAAGELGHLVRQDQVDSLPVQRFRDGKLPQLVIRTRFKEILGCRIAIRGQRVGRYNEFALFQESRP